MKVRQWQDYCGRLLLYRIVAASQEDSTYSPIGEPRLTASVGAGVAGDAVVTRTAGTIARGRNVSNQKGNEDKAYLIIIVYIIPNLVYTHFIHCMSRSQTAASQSAMHTSPANEYNSPSAYVWDL